MARFAHEPNMITYELFMQHVLEPLDEWVREKILGQEGSEDGSEAGSHRGSHGGSGRHSSAAHGGGDGGGGEQQEHGGPGGEEHGKGSEHAAAHRHSSSGHMAVHPVVDRVHGSQRSALEAQESMRMLHAGSAEERLQNEEGKEEEEEAEDRKGAEKRAFLTKAALGLVYTAWCARPPRPTCLSAMWRIRRLLAVGCCMRGVVMAMCDGFQLRRVTRGRACGLRPCGIAPSCS